MEVSGRDQRVSLQLYGWRSQVAIREEVFSSMDGGLRSRSESKSTALWMEVSGRDQRVSLQLYGWRSQVAIRE